MNNSLKSLTISATFSLVKKSANLLLSTLVPNFKNAFFKTLVFLMEPFLLPSSSSSSDHFNLYDEIDVFSSDPFPLSPTPFSHSSPEPLFLVPFRWWNEVREDLYGRGEGTSKAEVIGGVEYTAAVSFVRGREDAWDDMAVEDEDMIMFEMRREVETEAGEDIDSKNGNLALISEWMFLRALKWHDDAKDVEDHLGAEDDKSDLFSLQIRLSCTWQMNLLIIKISQKDNEKGAFSKACTIFGVKSCMIKVWDFSCQTIRFVDNNLLKDSSLPDKEILLELKMYGLSSCNSSKDNDNDEMMVERSNTEGSISSRLVNGDADSRSSDSTLDQSFSAGCSYGDAWILGLTGLYNLGNTCFMNSAIQCLAHTGKLVDFFLGDFQKDINVGNPLGMKGNLSIAFGDLLRKLWAPEASPFSPRMFKSVISGFAPQFSGYNQHDSQEFLAFLLDGLHEDLNRVKLKPYIESLDDDTRPDEIIAEEHWKNHLARNSSIIVDLCQGQYRSTLVCPDCRKKSVTFDPFMYLSLPLPSTTMRSMTVTVVSSHGTFLPMQVTIRVPQHGTSKDITQALCVACELKNDETLFVVEIFSNSIIRALDNPFDSIELIRDEDQLVAYRMTKEDEDYPLIEFIHYHEEKAFTYNHKEKFGFPLVARISDFSQGSEIQNLFLKLLSPFLLPQEESSYNHGEEQTYKEEAEMEELSASPDDENELPVDSDFQFVLDNKHYISKIEPIKMDEPVPISKGCRMAKVLVYWSPKIIENYVTALLSHLPQVYRPTFPLRRVESISLDKCLDAFLKEEPLGPEDMWYCPNCKKHQQASKKLDIWRLPEILVIHLKRFSYNRYFKNKLETFVDFPIDDFDLSSYLIKGATFSHHYSLYAVSNHYGGLGGGHYTAFAQHKHKRWYEFDDHRVFAVNEEQIRTSAAYVLFYRRV